MLIIMIYNNAIVTKVYFSDFKGVELVTDFDFIEQSNDV